VSIPVHHRFLQVSALLVGCAVMPIGGYAQTSFQSHQVAQGRNVLQIAAHGDFNNDGREDLMVNRFNAGGSVTGLLYLSSGDGTYQAPVTLPQGVSPGFTAVGDFNGDGKLDFAASGPSGSQVSVYLGNGNGTFQAAKIVSDSTYSGEYVDGIAAADMNHDGKTDLVEIILSPGHGDSVQLWISNGTGTFTAGQRSSGAVGGFGTFAGDFDGDGKPDIATVYADKGAATVQVWYGDGAGHVGSPFQIIDPNNYDDGDLQLADINNDGRSDLVGNGFIYGVSGTSQFVQKLVVFSGNSNRTLSYSNISTNQCPGSPAVADFNGDGINDLAYSEASCSTASTSNFVIRPGTGIGGFGAEQTVYQNTYGIYPPYAIRTTAGTKPDLVFVEDLGPHNNPSTNPPEALVLLSNGSTGSFPSCGVTGMAEGIRICAPGASASSPVKFSLGAAGPTAMRTAAVWVDGKKVTEQLAHAFSNYSFLDASIPLATGSHAITIYGTGWDDTLQKKSFTLTVTGSGGNCSAPSSPGVHVCMPANGSTVSSPVTVQAIATITGTLARMEVWVDGVKKYTETNSKTLNTSISLAAGSHHFTIYAVNTAGTKWQAVSTATVK
jgi:FG-GAP-like repeat/Bacterial Ig domain